MTVYALSAFGAIPKVKPLTRFYAEGRWWVHVRITSHPLQGPAGWWRRGQRIVHRATDLYCRRHTSRRGCHLYYSVPFDFMALQVAPLLGGVDSIYEWPS